MCTAVKSPWITGLILTLVCVIGYLMKENHRLSQRGLEVSTPPQTAAPSLPPAPASPSPQPADQKPVLSAEDAKTLQKLLAESEQEAQTIRNLNKEIETYETERSRMDAVFGKLHDLWQENRNWDMVHGARQRPELRSQPGLLQLQRVFWLEEYGLMLQNEGTRDLLRRYIQHQRTQLSPERLGIQTGASLQSWNLPNVIITGLLPAEIEQPFLANPDDILTRYRQEIDPQLDITEDEKTYLRDSIRATMLEKIARFGLTELLPETIKAKREEVWQITRQAGVTGHQINKLKQGVK